MIKDYTSFNSSTAYSSSTISDEIDFRFHKPLNMKRKIDRPRNPHEILRSTSPTAHIRFEEENSIISINLDSFEIIHPVNEKSNN